MQMIGRMTNGLGNLMDLYKDHLMFASMIVVSLFAAGYVFN